MGRRHAVHGLRRVARDTWLTEPRFSSRSNDAKLPPMGVDFAIELEAPQPTGSFTEEEVVAYYRATAGEGAPPLSTIREHVERALALSKSTGPDPTDALHSRFVDQYGRYRVWHDPGLAEVGRTLGVPTLESFQVSAPRWCSAADGLRSVRALRAHSKESRGDDAELIDCLTLVEQILEIAERDGRGWRLDVVTAIQLAANDDG